MIKLKWTVAPAPTGQYRSFFNRSWPAASFDDGTSAAQILCDDRYVPSRVKTNEHEELTIQVADWSVSDTEAGRAQYGSYKWRTLKQKCATLPEAKALTVRFFDEHPQYLPQSLRPTKAVDLPL